MSLTLGREALTNLISTDLATRNTNKGLIETEVNAKAEQAEVALNTTHKSSDGTDHANVGLNDTHRTGDGSDHADVATNTGDILAINNLKLSTAITITVGTGGDYATINEALAYATTRYPVYVSASVQPRVTISLLAGFVMAEQVIVDGQDLSWITISSVDAEVVITRSALTDQNDANISAIPAFTAQNCAFLPVIGALFNMDLSGVGTARHGVMACNNSRATVMGGCGVKNSGDVGIYAYQCSTVNAQDAIASGALTIGMHASSGSSINAVGANAQKGASPATTDFQVVRGSFISKFAGTGGVSQTVNTLTANGIIFG